jgi:hypothetical protein
LVVIRRVSRGLRWDLLRQALQHDNFYIRWAAVDLVAAMVRGGVSLSARRRKSLQQWIFAAGLNEEGLSSRLDGGDSPFERLCLKLLAYFAGYIELDKM